MSDPSTETPATRAQAVAAALDSDLDTLHFVALTRTPDGKIKKPAAKHWTRIKAAAGYLARYPGLGVMPYSAQLAVVDVDVHDGEPPEAGERVKAAVDALGEPLAEVLTPSGGRHLFYPNPGGAKVDGYWLYGEILSATHQIVLHDDAAFIAAAKAARGRAAPDFSKLPPVPKREPRGKGAARGKATKRGVPVDVAQALEFMRSAPAGTRNPTANDVAFTLARNGLWDDGVYIDLRDAAFEAGIGGDRAADTEETIRRAAAAGLAARAEAEAKAKANEPPPPSDEDAPPAGASGADAPPPEADEDDGLCPFCGRKDPCKPCSALSAETRAALSTLFSKRSETKRLHAVQVLRTREDWREDPVVNARALRSASGILGAKALADVFRQGATDGDDWLQCARPIRAIEAEELLPPLARNLAWPFRVCLAHGPAGSGKTRALAAAAAAVSNGLPWGGARTEASVVLWVAFEDMGGAVRLLRHHGANEDGVVFATGHELAPDWHGRFERLREEVQPAWIIVDSFTAIAAALGVDSNNADEATRLLQPLVKAAQAGCAVTFTHHEPHKHRRARNSGGIQAAVDAIFRVTHSPGPKMTVIAKWGKVRFGLEYAAELKLLLSGDGRTFTPQHVEFNEFEAHTEDIRRLLADDPKTSVRAVARALGLPEGGRKYPTFTALVEEQRKHFEGDEDEDDEEGQ